LDEDIIKHPIVATIRYIIVQNDKEPAND